MSAVSPSIEALAGATGALAIGSALIYGQQLRNKTVVLMSGRLPPDILAQLKDTLVAGNYHLFLGAGASFGGKDGKGSDMPLSDELRRSLIDLKSLKPGSSLSRAYAQLNQAEIDTHITDRFANCTPGPAISKVPLFAWKRIYTLNIDDALEAAYPPTGSIQRVAPATHLTPYTESDDPSTTQIVHVHGWARRPEDGYVFSMPEYAQTMGPNSPWITVLAHTLSTEPFIVAGTSLEEPDLEYFLAGRKSATVRRDRGPSILIEPYPDSATQKDCDRHGLVLYRGTFLEFLVELDSELPSRPLPIGLPSGLNEALFNKAPTKRELALFSRDFTFLIAQQASENADLGFYVGRRPTTLDIALGRDVSRLPTVDLKRFIRQKFQRGDWSKNYLLVDESAGAGKTTVLKRSLFDLAGEGLLVFEFSGIASPNNDLTSSVLSELRSPFIIFVDDFADHVAAIAALYRNIHRSDFLILGSERSYRMNHAVQVLGGSPFDRITLPPFAKKEALDLITKMESYGLTSFQKQRLDNLAQDICLDPIALAVCRIMNDFRPAEEIVRSLVSDSDEPRKLRYLACALASYCYRAGLSYPILVAGYGSESLDLQFRQRDILPLAYSDSNSKNYVVPMNPLLGQRFLREIASIEQDLLLEVYCALGAHIAPYVNRRAVIRRTPEARLAGRLFDYDDVVKEFLPDSAETFFLRMKRYWEWNSRYWEQFALMKLDQFRSSQYDDRFDILSQAISHAKHAVKVERHPLGLTTLGKILLEDMTRNNVRLAAAYREAIQYLDEAVVLEGKMSRIAVHPYMTMFNGTTTFLRAGGSLLSREVERLRKHIDDATSLFSHDSALVMVANELAQRITGGKGRRK